MTFDYGEYFKLTVDFYSFILTEVEDRSTDYSGMPPPCINTRPLACLCDTEQTLQGIVMYIANLNVLFLQSLIISDLSQYFI